MINENVLIFDFDGTIADSSMKVYEVLNNLAPDYGIDKVSISRLNELREHDYSEILDELKVPKYKIPFIYSRFKKEFAKIIYDLKPIPGMKDVLKELYEKNIQMYIVSSNTTNLIESFLEINNLNYFSRISGGAVLLGKHRKIKNILKSEDLLDQKRNVFYIGDELRDIAAARKAGVQSVAVVWGFNSKKSLQDKNPDYLLKTPKELLSI